MARCNLGFLIRVPELAGRSTVRPSRRSLLAQFVRWVLVCKTNPVVGAFLLSEGDEPGNR